MTDPRASSWADLEEYRQAPSGVGPHALNWADKPHRLVYDLVRLAGDARDAAINCQRDLTDLHGRGAHVNVQGCESESTDFVLGPFPSESSALRVAGIIQQMLASRDVHFGLNEDGEYGRIWTSNGFAQTDEVIEFYTGSKP